MSLTLDSGVASKRELRRQKEHSEIVLHDREIISRWFVVERLVSINDQRAKEDATHIHSRNEVSLMWAIPLDSRREEAGRFWAFFPTDTRTFLPGILNAPWKLNSDRNALIRGEWNNYLMRAAAHLIVETLPKLYTADDPGRILDAFPRQLDRQDDVARPLVASVWELLKTAEIIPDGSGTLRKASDLWQHTKLATDKAEIAKQWYAIADERTRQEYIHPSCLEGQRPSRLKELANKLDSHFSRTPNLRYRDEKEWFASVVSASTVIDLLQLAESYQNCLIPSEWKRIRETLAIIYCEDGIFRTSGQVVLAPQNVAIPDNLCRVTQVLVDNPTTQKILLHTLEVRPIDEGVWLAELQRAMLNNPQHNDQWLRLWRMILASPEKVRYRFVTENRDRLKIRRRDGHWVARYEVLLPGRLVSENDTHNQSVLIDHNIFPKDKQLLGLLDLSDVPDMNLLEINDLSQDESLKRWCREMNDIYFDTLQDKHERTRRSRESIIPSQLTMPRGWSLLKQLRNEANVEFTKLLSKLFLDKKLDSVNFRPKKQLSKYPVYPLCHFLPWLIIFHGKYQISRSIVSIATLLSIYDQQQNLPIEEWLRKTLIELSRVYPIPPDVPDEDISQALRAIIDNLPPDVIENETLFDFWDLAARYSVAPTSIPTKHGNVPINQVFITDVLDFASMARSRGYTAIALGSKAYELWRSYGAKELHIEVCYTSCYPPEPINSPFPELTRVLDSEALEHIVYQKVHGLNLKVIDTLESTPCILWNYSLLVDEEQIEYLSYSERISLILTELEKYDWLCYDKATALKELCDSELERRRTHVAQGANLAERLLRAVGQNKEVLLEALETHRLSSKDFLRQCQPLQLAELVLAYYGPATLAKLSNVLEKEHLQPPKRWNSAGAREFVTSLGFPLEFAISPEKDREPEEYISGPIELPSLHDFQQEILEGVHKVLTSSTGRRRAVISLPTGSGKTRVMVEAAVSFVLKPASVQRTVLWIAQTEELCEQAVQAFRQVWINRGASNTDLRIIRLWGGNPNPTVPETNQPTVVVASIQTLNYRVDRPDLNWLQKPGLVVIDECHHAITPSYTNLLSFLNAESSRSSTPSREEPPIIGLSATPFRTDDEESIRLARRFDNYWLPSNQEELYRRLRQQGILAEIEHELLESPIRLTEDEIDELSKLKELWEGFIFEQLLERINQRLAGIEQRNQIIINRICNSSEQSIMLFANSVNHAHEMALRLNHAGISAAVVSSETPSTARRYFLERFQRGDIRVLCNHTLLSTGFDAPKVDMILISRIVFSPVRYMQMVGRGLRGERNGGKAKCRVVTVLDNLLKFSSSHPYHYCQQLFKNYSQRW